MIPNLIMIGIKDKMKKRGIKEDQLVVAPIDIYNSKKAHNI